MVFEAPDLRYGRLRDQAETFLRQYHANRSIPVPIDTIVERDFQIDIVPIPGLQEAFDTVAFITRDLTEIRVDEYVFRSRLNRYRFSIAHELGHRILHADLFRQLSFDDIEGWKDVVTNAIPEDQYGYVEFHANAFAGLVLVPEAELKQVFSQIVERAEAAGLDLADAGAGARDTIEEYVAREFIVSPAVAHRRIEYDKLWAEFT